MRTVVDGVRARVRPSFPRVKALRWKNVMAPRTPMMPPTRPRRMPSKMTMRPMARREKPRVWRMAVSLTLPRTMRRTAFATRPRTAMTAPSPSQRVKPMSSIICLAVSAKKAFSGLVLVGCWSDLKVSSICLAMGSRRSDDATLTLNWVTTPRPALEACWRKGRWT